MILNSGVGGAVDADVGRLRRQHDGDQQLIDIVVFQLGLGLRHRLLRRAKNSGMTAGFIRAIWLHSMTKTPRPFPAVHFATSLVPHRSLSPEGFKWLIRGAIAANLLIGLPMMLLGAWPVLGFMGLDVWLLWFMFKRSYLDARRSETLLLTDRELIIDRVAPDGEREQHRLDAYWLRSSF